MHGEKVLDSSSTDANYSPSPAVSKILERVKNLNKKNQSWHHHMLFPDCTFNEYAPKHVLVLEDPETGAILVSLTDDEPTNDLKQIESLFYK